MSTVLDSHIAEEPPVAPRSMASLNPACVVCGGENPNGLHIRFRSTPEGVRADWAPTGAWESFAGVIHGGIIATVLDEAMSKAIMSKGWEALTVDLRTRFRRRVEPGCQLHILGWVVDRQKRRIRTEASIRDRDGQEQAHAWGTFLCPPKS